jgi:hypothetical protein
MGNSERETFSETMHYEYMPDLTLLATFIPKEV